MLPKGTRYRVRTLPSGEQQRLAFARGSNRVIEVKSESGKLSMPQKRHEARKPTGRFRPKRTYAQIEADRKKGKDYLV